MKFVIAALSLALAGCATSNRNPASQDSPEIQSKRDEALRASPVSVGDSFHFNQDVRFEVGSNKLALGTATYPNYTCALEVEPPRGEFVQNYVPKDMTLTVSNVQLSPGVPTVEVRLWKRAPSSLRSMIQALQQRGYDVSKKPINYDAKETALRIEGRPTRAIYTLRGSRLASRIVCESFERSYDSKTIYDQSEITKIDQAISEMKAGVTVGAIMEMVVDRYAAFEGRKSRIEFTPAPRSQQDYRLMPINLWQEPRRFEDVKLNSI